MSIPQALIEQVARTLSQARRVCVLTGAGVSAESGIPTFRGAGGLWHQYRPEELATPQAFGRNPKLVWEWYDWRRQKIAAAQPNPAHLTLAEMEKAFEEFCLITQNVDGLHQSAGSQTVVELHGSIWKTICVGEGTVAENREAPLRTIPPLCACGSLVRPGVVWFGEALPASALYRAEQASASCEVMLVVGTSALVHPAASFPALAEERGATIVEINPQTTPLSMSADAVLRAPAGEVLPKIWELVACQNFPSTTPRSPEIGVMDSFESRS